MGIEDIQISEELETNAPSIKYSGNEGPKSPQEEQMMMMASVDNPFFRDSDADEHSFRMFGKPYKELNESELEEFQEEMMRLMNKFSGGQPLPQDPTKPVNPFAPKPTGPTLPDRQMAAYGGIMGLDGRKKYGIGSWFQENIMDPIKENPEIAAAAALYGLDTFDVGIPGTGGGYINKGIKSIYDNPVTQDILYGKKVENEKDKTYTRSGGVIDSLKENLIPIAGGAIAGLFTNNQQGGGQDMGGVPSDNTAIQLADLKKTANILNQKQAMAAGLNFTPAVSARKYSPEEMIETYATAANGGRMGYNLGGRIGMAEGGIMDLGGMEKDYRAEGGFVPIGREEKADDVPARLSVNEFVFTADAVRNAGGGDIDKGAEVMENMMKHLEQGGQVSDESQGMAGAQQMFETSERLSEVI
jgi:hypothetical protein